MRFSLFCVLLSLLCSSSLAVFIQEVSPSWLFSAPSNSSITPVTSRHHRYVHTALTAANVIPEPLWRFGDTDLRWVAKESWRMESHVKITREMAKKKRIELRVDGADAVASVSVDGVQVGTTRNQHRVYHFDVTSNIHRGEGNYNLSLDFDSAITYADSRAAKYPYAVPPSSNFTTKDVHGEGARQFVRKAGCDFGWDWGPCFAPAGLLGGVQVNAYDSAIIRDVTWEALPRPSSDVWTANIDTFLHVAQPSSGNLRICLAPLTSTLGEKDEDLCNQEHVIKVVNHQSSLQSGDRHVRVTIDVPNPKLWWVRGMRDKDGAEGKQSLYGLQVRWVADDAGGDDEVSEKRLRVGFRTVELVQDPIINPATQEPSGLSFYLRVNGQAVFAKGTNLVPLASFHDRATRSKMRAAVRNVMEANGNIIRVWGGGIYQQKLLYDLADEMGIMIWQEFMFACAMYPSDPDFLNEVKEEAIGQVRRLKHHTSVVMWGGNNENEQALVQNWYGTSAHFELYKADYQALYIHTIMPVMRTEDPHRVFLPSSPSNGAAEEKEGYVSKNPQSEFYGDLHYYNYDADCWNVSGYMTPRMASEYGVQSMPSFITLKDVTTEEDWDLFSPLMIHRQHHPLGNGQLVKQITRHWPNVTQLADKRQQFDNTIYMTQLAQAMCVRFETEHYRRSMGTLDAQGKGHTMGALYWQLNDVWQAPSWSSIEITGRWKVLHHTMRHIFASLLLSPVVVEDVLHVFVVHDAPLPHSDRVEIEIQAWSWAKGLLKTWERDVGHISALSSVSVYNATIETLLHEAGDVAEEEVVFVLRLLNKKTKKEAARNVFFPVPPRFAVGIQNPQLQARVVNSDANDHHVRVQVTAEHLPAAFVWLETETPGHFEDNGFFLTESKKIVKFIPHEDEQGQIATNLHALVGATLQVRSLGDVTSSV